MNQDIYDELNALQEAEDSINDTLSTLKKVLDQIYQIDSSFCDKITSPDILHELGPDLEALINISDVSESLEFLIDRLESYTLPFLSNQIVHLQEDIADLEDDIE